MKVFIALLLLGFALFSSSAQASSLPVADAEKWVVSVGSGPSLALEFPLFERIRLGSSVGTPFYYGSHFGITTYDLRLQFPLLNQDGFMISIVAGLFGQVNLSSQSLKDPLSPIGLEMGACFAYLFSEQLRLRLNLVPGFDFVLPPENAGLYGWTFLAPASGFEVAWRFTPQFEASLGFNGNGDILSLSGLF
jgi:hypothetical protein